MLTMIPVGDLPCNEPAVLSRRNNGHDDNFDSDVTVSLDILVLGKNTHCKHEFSSVTIMDQIIHAGVRAADCTIVRRLTIEYFIFQWTIHSKN